MFTPTTDTVVEVLGCRHTRASAEAAIAHLRAANVWGPWMYACLVGGLCQACQDDQERAA